MSVLWMPCDIRNTDYMYVNIIFISMTSYEENSILITLSPISVKFPVLTVHLIENTTYRKQIFWQNFEIWFPWILYW